MNRLLVRAVVAFVALPGVVAFAAPLLLAMSVGSAFTDWWGSVPLGLGSVLLFACVREFYVAGRGTLAPWAPPSALVVTGPYQRTRNPMYVAVVLILLGWAVGFHSGPIAVYAVVVLVAFHLRVVLYEEPQLAKTFADDWTRYRQRVRRWLPSLESLTGRGR